MNRTLPWQPGTHPLMLAPMQGLTNRALRTLFCEWIKPDVVFTEFIRVRPGSRKPISQVDQLEVSASNPSVPLVTQLIGRDVSALVAAAEAAQEAGARHLNINLGCPYGRMNAGSAGGALLKNPGNLAQSLKALRAVTLGSFSVKVRSGYDDPEQIFSLLPVFEECGIDFLVLHPRTVVQKFSGSADHHLTARVINTTSIPVIANGDITTASEGHRLMAETGAAGLMLGRGAIRDPLLFKRLRGEAPENPARPERVSELQYYLRELTRGYREIFSGDPQVLCKLKTVMNMLREDELLGQQIRKILRAKSLERFTFLVEIMS